MRIPDHKIEEILDKSSIVDVISNYTQLKMRSGRHWGLCPFHTEKTPSFSVNEDKNMYYCFGCHKGGTLFNFLMDVEKLSFIESVKLMAEKTGVDIEVKEESGADKKRTALYDLYTRVAGSFSYILNNTEDGKKPLKYLTDRGLDKNIIEKFQIGFAPNDPSWLYKFLTKKNFTPDFLGLSGLFSKNRTNFPLFFNRIMFPIKNVRGQVIAFGGRALRDDGPKYINSPETMIYKKGSTLFGLDIAYQNIRKSEDFILSEGYFDVIALHMAGIETAVAPLGTAFTNNQARVLKRYSSNGTILFDSDSAGITATKKVILICEDIGIHTKVVSLKEAKDPADILQKDGKEALHKLVKCPINSFEYLVQTEIELEGNNNPEAKETIIRNIFPFIQRLDSAILRSTYIKRLSEELSIDADAIIKDFSKIGNPNSTNNLISLRKDKDISNDLFFMLTVVSNTESYATIRNEIQSDDLVDPLAKDIFISLEEGYRRDENSFESLLNRIDNDDLKGIIIRKLATEEYSINTDKIIKDSLCVIKERSIKSKIKELENKLSYADKTGIDHHILKDYLSEKIALDGELKKLKVINNDRTAD